MAAPMNKNVRVIKTANSDGTKFTETFVSERTFHRDTFKQFLVGDAAYMCNSLFQFSTLFQMLRFTNICMFNANYKTEGISGDDGSVGVFREALPSAFEDLEVGIGDYWVIIWTVPQDTPGSYDISPEFMESVASTIGSDVLTNLRRMEFRMVKSAQHSGCRRPNFLAIDWVNRSLAAVDAEKDGYYVPVEVDNKSIGGPVVPPNTLFNIVYPKFEMIGVTHLATIIEKQLRYQKSLKRSLKNFMNYVAATIADLNRNSSDCDSMSVTLMKAHAILAWLADPHNNRTCICFSSNDNNTQVVNQLTSIMMFSGMVLPTQFFKCTGVFMDASGMIHYIRDDTTAQLIGYKLIEDCDDAIDLIYKTIKDTVITPLGDNGPNFLALCHYPVFDNVPSIFWNGRLF